MAPPQSLSSSSTEQALDPAGLPTASIPAPGQSMLGLRPYSGWPLWAHEPQASSAPESSGPCSCPFISLSLWPYLPHPPQAHGSPALNNLPLPGSHLLQALPSPAVQLNLLQESWPTPWTSSSPSILCLRDPFSPSLPLARGSPCQDSTLRVHQEVRRLAQ